MMLAPLVPLAVPLVRGNYCAAAADACTALTGNLPLTHFAGGSYRPSVPQMRAVDMGLLAALAAIQAFWPTPATPADAAGRGTLNVAVLLLAAWYIATRQPFPADGKWKLWLKVGSLLLAALAAVLTHFNYAMSLRWPAGEAVAVVPSNAATVSTDDPSYARDAAIRSGLSYVVFVGCMLLMATLAVGFWVSTIKGIRVEARALLLLRAAQEAAAASAAAASRLSLTRANSSSSTPRWSAAQAERLGESSGGFAGRIRTHGSGGGGGMVTNPLKAQLPPLPLPLSLTLPAVSRPEAAALAARTPACDAEPAARAMQTQRASRVGQLAAVPDSGRAHFEPASDGGAISALSSISISMATACLLPEHGPRSETADTAATTATPHRCPEISSPFAFPQATAARTGSPAPSPQVTRSASAAAGRASFEAMRSRRSTPSAAAAAQRRSQVQAAYASSGL